MSAGSSSRRIRTDAVKGTLATLSSSGSVPVPYGRGVIKISGVGAPGTAAYGGAYNYTDPPVLSAPAYTDPPVLSAPATYAPAYNDPPVLATPDSYAPAYTDPPVLSAPAYNDPPVYSSTTVTKATYYAPTDAYAETFQTRYDGGCPSNYTGPINTYNAFSCANNYTAGAYHPATYSAGATHPAVYTPATYSAGATHPAVYTPATYSAGAYHPATYTAGPSYYYPYVGATTGASATAGGVSFPGGNGGPATPINNVVIVAARGSSINATVPSGAYVTVTVA